MLPSWMLSHEQHQTEENRLLDNCRKSMVLKSNFFCSTKNEDVEFKTIDIELLLLIIILHNNTVM